MKKFIVVLTLFQFFYAVQLHPLGTNYKRDVIHTHNHLEAVNYLHKYGYLKDTDGVTDEKMKAALTDYQNFIGLKCTGEMDQETIDMMKLSRCGIPDKMEETPESSTWSKSGEGSRSTTACDHKLPIIPEKINLVTLLTGLVQQNLHFRTGDQIWEKRRLIYRVEKYTDELQRTIIDEEFKRAMNVWSKFIKIRIKPAKQGQKSDINVQFVPFDASEGSLVLGFASNPPNGSVYFNDNVIWTKNDEEEGIQLFQWAVHEFGHSLGLGHSDNNNSVMYPCYQYTSKFTLHMEDVKGIKALYKVIPCPEVPRLADNTILCADPKINAIFTAPDYYVYVLKGDKYWKLTLEFIMVEGPNLIKDRWPEVPNDVDSAFTYWNNITYFLKERYMWKYIKNTKSGRSKLISVGFSGIPDNVNASLVWSGNGKIYFFKGVNYWMFDPQKPANLRVNNTYPRPISTWNGLPNNLDAAVAVGGSSYFFKDNQYYKYDDRYMTVEEGYPRNTATDLFGCT